MKNILSLICNLVLVLWTAAAVGSSVFYRDGQKEKTASAHTFRYFTTDSNVLAALTALILLVFNIRALFTGETFYPEWALLLKYIGTVSVMVTFLTVAAFLGPTQGYRIMFEGYGLYLHAIGPVLAAVSFCFLEKGTPLSWAQALLGLLPTVLYGTLYLYLAVVRGEKKGGWPDFYGFNLTGKWPISYGSMVAGTALICAGLRLLHNLA